MPNPVIINFKNDVYLPLLNFQCFIISTAKKLDLLIRLHLSNFNYHLLDFVMPQLAKLESLPQRLVVNKDTVKSLLQNYMYFLVK